MLKIKTTGLDEFLDPSGGSWVKALILGQPGAGKTRSASAWVDPIYADCERGLASVADKGVAYASITSLADMEALLDYLRKDGLLPPERRKHRTFILDTVDTFQKILMAERLRAERRDALTMQDWGYVGTKLTQVIDKMLNLPMNIVVNMHVLDERDTDGETEILVKKSALKGALGTEIYNHFDLIGLMETSYVAKDGERVLQRQIRWHSEPKFPMLRDRFGKLPRFTDVDFTEDDYNRIFNAITAGVDDLPATGTVESLPTGDDLSVDPAPADLPGGPVANVETPPAKKAAAKKAAKKAAPKPAATEVATATPVEAKPVTDESETAKAEALLQEKLGAESVTESVTEPPAGESQESPEKSPEPPQKSGGDTVYCGTSIVADGTPMRDGCGVEITDENKSRVQIARLKFKTNLCESCYAAATN